jgi:hypothetical protein
LLAVMMFGGNLVAVVDCVASISIVISSSRLPILMQQHKLSSSSGGGGGSMMMMTTASLVSAFGHDHTL